MDIEKEIRKIEEILRNNMVGNKKMDSVTELTTIEEIWDRIDDLKYKNVRAKFVCGSMVNRYAKIPNEKEVEKWISRYLKCINQNSTNFDINYFIGSSYSKCDSKEKALKYLNMCYTENKEQFLSKAESAVDKRVIDYFLKNMSADNHSTDDIYGKNEVYTIQLDKLTRYFGKIVNVEYKVDLQERGSQISAIQKKALDYLRRNQEHLLEVILDSVYLYYPKWKKDYDISDIIMPPLQNKNEICKMISMNTIYLFDEEYVDHPYLGFQFGCTWDTEHGLGILMYKDIIIEIGEAEIAFSSRIVKKHSLKQI